MKKYTNTAMEMRSVTFENNVTQFLRRGQSIISDKPTKRVEKGIRVTDVRRTKRIDTSADAGSEE